MSPLLRLPPELRNHIYGFVFSEHIHRISIANRKADRLHAATKTLASLRLGRHISHDARIPPCTASTSTFVRDFPLPTSDFIALCDTGNVAVDCIPRPVLDRLESQPALWIGKLDVVGFVAGRAGFGRVSVTQGRGLQRHCAPHG
ncbi:uncharacterized protein EKO05_0002406 [Ascochyta rabiei]|nr:uncharacterized protein EKO05_0002406 [Ascochyta rabiei]UPX11818.1 hypothetical protein EKO05_0002406 [Ascochyta rabiei]